MSQNSSRNGARKDDAGKPPLYEILQWVDSLFLIDIMRVLKFGANKYYGQGHWNLGMDRTRLANAVVRHLDKYMSGDIVDEESGLSHLAHAACSLMFMHYYDRQEAEPLYKCSKCGRLLSKSDFNPRLDRPRGVSSQCKECAAKREARRRIIIFDSYAVIELQDHDSCIVDIDVALHFYEKGILLTKDSDGYVTYLEAGKRKKLHKYVMMSESSEVVDHIDRNKRNNLSSNLRIVTPSENMKNKDKRGGEVHVSYNSRDRAWVGYVYRDGQRIHLAHGKDKDEVALKAWLHFNKDRKAGDETT
jgi:DNA-directed RNA polymerase subunit RPC12/RpoP